MKNIIFAIMVLIPSFCFSQNINSLKEWFVKFEIEAEISYAEEGKILTVKDLSIINTGDITFEISYLLTAFDLYLKDNKIKYENLNIEKLIYSVKDFQIVISTEWIVKYYSSKKNDRKSLLSDLLMIEYSKQQKLQMKF
jgi:hypothetical protein